MKCKQCGFESEEGTLFCTNCGYKFDSEESSAEQDEQAVEQIDQEEGMDEQTEPVSEQPVSDQPVSDQPVSDQSVVNRDDSEAPKKKSKLPIVIGLVALLAVIGSLVVFGKNLPFFKSDEELFIEAANNTQKASRKAVVGEFQIEDFSLQGVGVMEAAVVENIIRGLSVNYELRLDTDAYKMEGKLGFSLNGSDLMDVNLHLNKEYIAVSLPSLYDKTIYLNWDDMKEVLVKFEMASEEEVADFDAENMIEKLDAYLKAVDYKSFESYKAFDEKQYNDMMYGYLFDSMTDASKGDMTMEIDGETLNYSGKVYTFDLAMDDYMTMAMKMFEMLIKDENILPMLIEAEENVIDTAIEKEDFEMYNSIVRLFNLDLDIEGVDAWSDDVKNNLLDLKKDLNVEISNGYGDIIAEMKEEMDTEEYKESMDLINAIYSEVQVESKAVVEDNYIKGVEAVITVNDSILDAMSDAMAESNDDMSMYLPIDDMDDIFFEIVMAQRIGVKQINEDISFDGLPDDAVDFSTLDDEELYDIYMEIIMNFSSITSSFSDSL